MLIWPFLTVTSSPPIIFYVCLRLLKRPKLQLPFQIAQKLVSTWEFPSTPALRSQPRTRAQLSALLSNSDAEVASLCPYIPPSYLPTSYNRAIGSSRNKRFGFIMLRLCSGRKRVNNCLLMNMTVLCSVRFTTFSQTRNTVLATAPELSTIRQDGIHIAPVVYSNLRIFL